MAGRTNMQRDDRIFVDTTQQTHGSPSNHSDYFLLGVLFLNPSKWLLEDVGGVLVVAEECNSHLVPQLHCFCAFLEENNPTLAGAEYTSNPWEP